MSVDKRHGGDSQPQREAERIIIEAVNLKLGLGLRHRFPVRTSNGARLNFDGGSDNPAVLCEVYSRCGKLTGAQPHKVITDALRLVFARQDWNPSARLILAFCDATAARSFCEGDSWKRRALAAFGIELCLVELPPAERARLVAAQRTQAQSNQARRFAVRSSHTE